MKSMPQGSLTYQQPRRRVAWRRILLIIASCLLLLTIIGFLFSSQLSNFITSIEPSCSLGFSGTTASLTIKGWTANQDCQAIQTGQTSFLSVLNLPNSLISLNLVYPLSQSPQEPVVCEVQYGGRDLVVRDADIFHVVGIILCQGLMKLPKK